MHATIPGELLLRRWTEGGSHEPTGAVLWRCLLLLLSVNHIKEILRQAFYLISVAKYNALNEFKCNLKELTTKSAWVPRSAVFSMCIPCGWLHRSCDSLARSVFSRAGFCRPFSSPPVLPLGLFGFSPLMFFQCDGACSFPLVWGLMAGLRCCASHGGIISI